MLILTIFYCSTYIAVASIFLFDIDNSIYRDLGIDEKLWLDIDLASRLWHTRLGHTRHIKHSAQRPADPSSTILAILAT